MLQGWCPSLLTAAEALDRTEPHSVHAETLAADSATHAPDVMGSSCWDLTGPPSPVASGVAVPAVAVEAVLAVWRHAAGSVVRAVVAGV